MCVDWMTSFAGQIMIFVAWIVIHCWVTQQFCWFMALYHTFTLWLFNIAMENGPFLDEHDDLPTLWWTNIAMENHHF